MMPTSLVDGGALLQALREAPVAERSELIAQILVNHARPIVAAMLRSAFARSLVPEDSADIEGEITLKLVHRLNLVVEAPEAPLGDFASYVRTVTYHAIQDHRRRLHPARARLANRIRYVLTHDRRVACWGNGGLVCGLAAWAGRPQLRSVAPRPAVATARGATLAPPVFRVTPARLQELVHAALVAAGGPMAFDHLVSVLAESLQIVDEHSDPPEPDREQDQDPSGRVIARDYLKHLWAEMVALPVRQRQALLLHLRFDDDESVARQLLALGLSDIRGIARVLEMPLSEVLELWNELPLGDLRIAALMGLTRQQVINLRKSARERLTRRMHGV